MAVPTESVAVSSDAEPGQDRGRISNTLPRPQRSSHPQLENSQSASQNNPLLDLFRVLGRTGARHQLLAPLIAACAGSLLGTPSPINRE